MRLAPVSTPTPTPAPVRPEQAAKDGAPQDTVHSTGYTPKLGVYGPILAGAAVGAGLGLYAGLHGGVTGGIAGAAAGGAGMAVIGTAGSARVGLDEQSFGIGMGLGVAGLAGGALASCFAPGPVAATVLTATGAAGGAFLGMMSMWTRD